MSNLKNQKTSVIFFILWYNVNGLELGKLAFTTRPRSTTRNSQFREGV